MEANGEALQLHVVYKKRIFYYKSHKNPYRIRISTTSTQKSE